MVEARRIVDEFRILKLLKAAPQTTLFHAQDPRTGREVVLKLLNALGGTPPEENRRRFLDAVSRIREAGLPCLPEVMDHGLTPDGRAFLVMSYEEGIPLSEFGTGSPETLLALLAGVAQCLAAMADAGVFHHNLAPANVDVIGEGVRLVGLGSAAFLGAGAAGGLMGHSPEWDSFAAPELMDAELDGTGPGWKADLYSAALVACRVLGATVESAAAASPAVVLPETVRAEMADPVGLEEVLATCLRREPSRRRVTLSELAETLRTGGEAAPMPDLADLGAPGPPSRRIGPPAVSAPAPPAELFDPNKTRPSFTPEDLASFVVEEDWEHAAHAEHEDTLTPPPLPGTAGPPPETPAPPPVPSTEQETSGRASRVASGSGEFETVLAQPASPVPPESSREDAPGGAAGDSAPAVGQGLAAGEIVSGIRERLAALGVRAVKVLGALRQRVGETLERGVERARAADRRVLIAVAAAGVLVVAAIVVMLVVHRGAGGGERAVKGAAEPVPAVVVVQPDGGEARTPGEPQPDPRIEEARAALDAGDSAAARTILAGLGTEDVAAFSEEDRAAYEELRRALEGSARDRAVRDLETGLKRGRPRTLRRALRSLEALPRSELRTVKGLRAKMARARKALRIHTLLWRAKKAGDDLQVIERAGELLKVLPAYTTAETMRRQAAQSVEARAAEAAAQDRPEEALTLLEKERELWPDREGVEPAMARYRQEVERRRDLEDTLQRAQQALDAGNPRRGLAILGGVTPTGAFVARFDRLRARLEEALRARDAQAPKVMLQPGFKLRFKKNQTLVIPFLAMDDLGVKSVTAHLRREGERNFREIPLRHAGGDRWSLALTPELHENKTVELFIEAADGSGHLGELGSAQRPLRVLRKRWFQK